MSDGMRRVVCAAIRAPDGEVLIGVRHYDVGMCGSIEARCDGKKFENRIGPDQGFVDQFGTFMNRVDAFEVAVKAGQTNARGPALYSEDLY